MNDRGMPVFSIVKMEEIEKVRQNLEKIIATCFTREEAAELSSRHVRSTAGNLALKRALAALFAEKWAVDLREKDIVVSRSDSGAPVFALRQKREGAHPGFDISCIFLSLSHSKTIAYGLAVYQEKVHG